MIPIQRGINTLRRDGLDRLLLLSMRYASWSSRFQDRISILPPKVRGTTSKTVISSYRSLIRILAAKFPLKYTDADPYKIIYIDPERIQFISGLHDQKRRGWVIAGNWDLDRALFSSLPLAKAVKQHYQEDVPWDETILAENYSSKGALNQKIDHIENLARQIESEGFMNQRELLESNPTHTWKGLNATFSPYTNEITADIGRNGEILWNMLGKHRLSLAKVMGIQKVPVMVNVRHRDWQKTRNELRIQNTVRRIESPKSHPDLKDLIEK